MLEYYINKIVCKEDLCVCEAEDAFRSIMSGEAEDFEIAVFLTALKTKGESAGEIAGFVKIMKEKAAVFKKDGYYIDTCGTGGDKKGHINISTISALIAASLGIKTVKHGNRAVSGKCGSADVLEALGIKINLTPDESYHQLKETSFAFLYAPIYHKAVKYVGSVRKKLGFPTVFNFLGPLSNPATIDGHVLGVYKKELVSLGAETLFYFGVKKALVVHGLDGSDEISVSGRTLINKIEKGKIVEYIYEPKKTYNDMIYGKDAVYNAEVSEKIFENKIFGGLREFVLINAAAAVFVSDMGLDLDESYEAADEVLKNKSVIGKLHEIIEFQTKSLKKEN